MARREGWREQKKARTRHRIVTEALRLFAAHGYQGTSVAAIAEASEISVATFYNYFHTKQDVLFADDERWRRLPRSLTDPAGGAPRQLLLQAFREFLAQDWLLAASNPTTAASFVVIQETPELFVAHQRRVIALQDLWIDRLQQVCPFAQAVALVGALWGAVDATVRHHSGPELPDHLLAAAREALGLGH